MVTMLRNAFFVLTLFLLLARPVPSRADDASRVLFLGDSLTAGYGVTPDEAYPSQVKQLALEDGVKIDVVNAGASGDTTAGALRRLDWVMQSEVDVLVVALGANDGLRGLDLEQSKSNLAEIVRRTKKKFPGISVLLLKMELPPSFGEPYVSQFREMYSQVARDEGVTLGPFVLEDVGGIAELNQRDRIHPNARGHELMARSVWKALKPLVEKAPGELVQQ